MTAERSARASRAARPPAGHPETRILVVNDHLGWENQISGVTRLFEMWAAHLPPDRYRVAVCILGQPSPLANGLRRCGCPVLYLPKRKYDPSTLYALTRLVSRERIDVLHLQGYRGTTFGRLAARLAGVPSLIHFHDTSTNYPAVQKLSDRLLGRMGDAHLAVSRSVRRCWAARVGLAEERIRVLYNCAPLYDFRCPSLARVRESRIRLGIPPDARVVGSVTRLFPEKGTRYLVEAMPHVLARCPDAWCVVVGDGPQRRELEALTRRLGIAGRVHFLGYREDVEPVLAAFDVNVLASRFEGGSPLPVLEAMAMERPVVATDLVEIVEDGVTGLLVPPGDVARLGEAVVAVLTDPVLAGQMASRARRAVERFDVKPYVAELGEVYDALVARRSSDRSPRLRRTGQARWRRLDS